MFKGGWKEIKELTRLLCSKAQTLIMASVQPLLMTSLDNATSLNSLHSSLTCTVGRSSSLCLPVASPSFCLAALLLLLSARSSLPHLHLPLHTAIHMLYFQMRGAGWPVTSGSVSKVVLYSEEFSSVAVCHRSSTADCVEISRRSHHCTRLCWPLWRKWCSELMDLQLFFDHR